MIADNIKISSRGVGKWLTKIDRKIVRTYKGDIERNQLGAVIKFPAAFMTLGFDLEWTGPRDELKVIQQLLLAADVFLFYVDEQVRGNDYKGDFSATSCEMTDIEDKNENYATLTASIVNVNNLVTDHAGNKFSVVKVGSTTTTVVQGNYGEEVTIPSQYASYKVINPVTGEEGGYLPSKVVLIGNVFIKQ